MIRVSSRPFLVRRDSSLLMKGIKMSYDSSNNPYYLEQLPMSEQQFIQGSMLDLEFMTTEDKFVFNNLYQRYFKPNHSINPNPNHWGE